jgi:MFS family permease
MFMMPELNLTEIQMGQAFSAFMVGYTVCQIPAGLLADWLGPRKVLVTAVLGWAVINVLTGIVPGTLVMVGTFRSRLSQEVATRPPEPYPATGP